MKISPIEQVVLLGGSWLTASFAPLSASKIKTVVFSCKRQLEEVVTDDGKTLEEVLKEKGIGYYSSENINEEPKLEEFAGASSIGIGLGPAWAFSRKTIDLFEGQMVDFMGIDLPRFLGGAHYTWQILMGNKAGSCNLQIINEVPASGNIIRKKNYRFDGSARTPRDYFGCALKEEVVFLEEFLDEVRSGKEYEEEEIDVTKTLYLPFLHTKTQGWVNWGWEAKEIESFICAFDEPYAGSSTLLDGKRVFLKGGKLIESEDEFHPFQSGLIFRKTDNEVFVAAKKGALSIASVKSEEGEDLISSIKLGQRLFTPSSILDEAVGFHTEYCSGGLKK